MHLYWRILEKVFVTKKCTQCKTLNTFKTDVFEIPNNRNIGKFFSKYDLFSLDQVNFISDPSQILILQYPFPTASCLPRHLSHFFPCSTETPLQRNLHHVLHRIPFFSLPYLTTRYSYWIHVFYFKRHVFPGRLKVS